MQPTFGSESAVVVQTHVITPHLVKRFALAKSQLAAHGIPFYVSFLIGDSASAACPDGRGPPHEALDSLRAAISSESVWCLDPRDHAAVLPTFFKSLEAFAPAHRSMYGKPTAIAGLHWSWIMCDMHAIVGAYRHRLFGSAADSLAAPPPSSSRLGRPHQQLSYLWVFDYDITWAGDLGAFVDAFAAEPADLLVAKDNGHASSRKNHKGQITYAQFSVRNYLADEAVYSALLAPVRYSARMLERTRGVVADGQLAFCETRGPSLCRAQPSWCTQRSMLELRPELFSANFSCCKSHSERFSSEREQEWRRLPEAARPPVQLLHRVKLDGAAQVATRQSRHANKTHTHNVHRL